MIAKYRPMFTGEAPVIAAGGFTPASAERAVTAELCDAVAFGRLFLSTPDLPSRIANSRPPNRYDRQTFYTVWSKPMGTEGKSEEELRRGYTDYPLIEDTTPEQLFDADSYNL